MQTLYEDKKYIRGQKFKLYSTSLCNTNKISFNVEARTSGGKWSYRGMFNSEDSAMKYISQCKRYAKEALSRS